MSLRKKLIRLAYQRPEFRSDLLPLLTKVKGAASLRAYQVMSRRVIPLDREELQKVTKELVGKIKRGLSYMNPEVAIADFRPDSLQFGFRITNPFTQEQEKILLQVLPAKGRNDLLGGHFIEGTNKIALKFNESLLVGDLLDSLEKSGPRNPEKEIRSVLVHEITHMMDPGMGSVKDYQGAGAEMQRWLNQPVEYAAFISQVVNEITSGGYLRSRLFRMLPKGKKFEKALKLSQTWEKKSEFLNPHYRKRALSTVYQEIQEYLA